MSPPLHHHSMVQDRLEVTASEALDLQPLFDARPLGYGGADVAASFRAPPLDGDGGRPHTLWLLGDTFLGRADKERGQRLPGYFVHNSIAAVPVWSDPGKEADPARVAFWHNVSAAGGCPSSLFRHPSELQQEGGGGENDNECHEGGQYLWPVAGMGVDLSKVNEAAWLRWLACRGSTDRHTHTHTPHTGGAGLLLVVKARPPRNAVGLPALDRDGHGPEPLPPQLRGAGHDAPRGGQRPRPAPPVAIPDTGGCSLASIDRSGFHNMALTRACPHPLRTWSTRAPPTTGSRASRPPHPGSKVRACVE